MAVGSLEAKRLLKEKMIKECFAEDNTDDEMEEQEEAVGDSYADDEKKKRASGRRGPGAVGVSPPCCTVENCGADLTDAREYHQRHKVCQFHSKAPVLMAAGLRKSSVSNAAGSMSYLNLMKQKGVVADVWPDTMRSVGRALLKPMAKADYRYLSKLFTSFLRSNKA